MTQPIRIRLARPDVGAEELAAIEAVLASGVLTNGPRTKAFEDAFAARHGVEHAVAFANGTVALQAMYLGLGIGPGDEVIVPSMTFVSSATSVVHAGATPVFADIEPVHFGLDPEDVARRVTPRTKAVLVVHYGGQPADMDALQAVADDAGILLLEDAAQAHGASYNGRPAGSLGRAAMFSFTPTKNITTGEGGMVTTDDAELAARLRLLRNHGQASVYEHVTLGYNWRITEMQAAMGIVQLGKLDTILARKAANAEFLRDRIGDVPGLTLPSCRAGSTHPYMLYTTLVEHDRDAVLAELLARGIEAKIYFPPAHRQPMYEGQPAPNLPVTDDVYARMLSIPFHAQLTSDELAEVADALVAAVVSSRA